MTTWMDFTRLAPRISDVFARRHAATGNLCMLGTLRSDGFPRICPLEPRFFADDLWLIGMPRTLKFDDLVRDPRFCLHTATVDTQVTDGDAKLFGVARDMHDPDLIRRFTEDLFDETGVDVRGEVFDHFFAADITGASAVEVVDDHLDITIWRPGEREHVVQKH